MFRDDMIQSMGFNQTYEFIVQLPEDIVQELPETLPFEQTKIVLGFYATRFNVAGGKPAYTFEVTSTGTSLIHPRELVLDDSDWHDLMHDYLDEESESESHHGSVIEDSEVLDDNEVRDEIIDAIIDAGHECELYQKMQYTFSTEEPAIESTYERGVTVNNAMMGYASTTYHQALDRNWEAVTTPDDGVHFIPPRLSPEELHIADEIDVNLRFIEFVTETGLQNDARMNTLMPEQDKIVEMLYLVECMRQRRIKTLRDLRDN